MEIIERYLQAVKFWLPAEHRDDILAELRDDLFAEAEEKAEAAGRPLDDREIETLLARRGRPALVASRYFPQRQLIGPTLYPAYAFALKAAALCFLVPWMAVQLAGILLVAPTATVGSWFAVNADLVSLAFFAWSVLTLAFAAAERLLTRSDLLTHWDPRKLPPLREQSAVSRTASAFELVFQLGVGALVPVWMLWAASPSGVFHVGDLEIGLSPAWITFLWSVALLSLANAALAAANLAWPWWTVRRALARAACNCGIGILSWWGMQSHLLAHIASPEIALERARDITAAINLGLEQVAPLALVVWGIVLAVDIYRVWRVSTARTGGRETGWPASPALKS